MLRILTAWSIDTELRQPLGEQFERRQRLLDPRRPFRDWYALPKRGAGAPARRPLRGAADALQEWRDERRERTEVAPQVPTGCAQHALEVRTSDSSSTSTACSVRAATESSVERGAAAFSATAYRTNEIMRTLTAITAVFLP